MSEQITPNPSVPTQVVAEVSFPKFINNLGIIPTSYKDSMSYYECLAWLCKYLEETVIPSVNQNGQAVEELQGLYIELNSYVTNYFNNLDVQEEINNKLDQMVLSGALQRIVYEYFDEINQLVAELDEELTNKFNTLESNTTSSLSQQDGQIATLEARMDTFTNLTEGSTSGDAELADGRISFDGRTFANIGGNIRSFQGAYFKDITSTLTEVEEAYVKVDFTTASSQYFNYYKLDTKLGHLYYIDTTGNYSARQVVYAKNQAIPATSANVDYPDPILFEGNGTTIYINSKVGTHFSVHESIKYNNINELSTYYKKLTIGTSDADVIQTENYYMRNAGEPAALNTFDYFTITPKKGHIYYFKSSTTSAAPLIYQNGPKPEYATSYSYSWGFYSYIAQSNDNIYINLYKGNKNADDEVEIYESIMPVFIDTQFENNYNGMIANAIFCGDSLTYGQTYTAASTSYRNYFNYPYFVKKLMQIDNITEYATPGATNSSWWSSYNENITESNSVYFIWLGTNSQMTDTVATDCSGDDYTQFATTETGYLGKILGKIASLDNNKIVILNNFSTVGTLSINNKVISDLATKYNAILVNVNTTDVTNSKYHTSYNNYYNAVHFNSAGHNYIANLVTKTLIENLETSPDLLEVYEVHD